MKKIIEKVLSNCANINERGRIMLSASRIRDWIVSELTKGNDYRAINCSANKTSQKIFAHFQKDKRHYEFEPGTLHFFGNL